MFFARDIHDGIFRLYIGAKFEEFVRRTGDLPLSFAEKAIHARFIDNEGMRIADHGQRIIISSIFLPIAPVFHMGKQFGINERLYGFIALLFVCLGLLRIDVVQAFQRPVRIFAQRAYIQSVEHINIRG